MTIYSSTYLQHKNYPTTMSMEIFSDLLEHEDMHDFNSFLKANKVNDQSEMNEFEQYLNDPLFSCSCSESFDILTWWKANAQKYPLVSSIARDILAISITSVASESVNKLPNFS